ncbi:adenine deaminase [Candidatus Marinamargulisbacteria bacterium SCGC AAA071-K20]|nr:adenine deaminase [Candidatus Marinamargulisbacteria bacterium SCGC AAA071-K20]
MQIKGFIVDVVSKRIFSGKVIIEGTKVVDVIEEENDSNQFIMPGFVDAHVHVESSMLIPSEFARLAVCHGTVATISDPHEIGNVLGVEGVKFMIRNGKKTPFKFHFGAPSCVPATAFETAGATIGVQDIKDLLAMDDIHYLTEMMNFPGVLGEDPEVMAKIKAAKEAGKVIDGHAPGLRGDDAKKYSDAGITTDHECFTIQEALDKLKYGMKIQIREGSAAKNFEALINLLNQYPDKIMFCSDDKHPNDLAEKHINVLAKRAVAKGCDTMNVIRACTYNIVKHYSMNVGLLQKGDDADFCIVDDLVDFNCKATYINGALVSENGKTKIDSVVETPVNNFNCSPITINQIEVPATSTTIKVIDVEDGQLITKESKAELSAVDGNLVSDPSQDILKVVVVNRYFDAPPAVAFIRNFGLNQGALASCVAHDSHNIIAVGVSDQDIVNAINLVVESKGGVSLANGEEQSLLALPVAGIMTHKDGFETAAAYEKIDLRSKELGVTLESPYMTMSFCALLVIPELKLSDKGLFNGNKFEFTGLYI